MWIDSHAHLADSTDTALDIIVTEASAAGVGIIVSTAVDTATARAVITQCEKYSMIWGAVGISPFDVESLPHTWSNELGAMLAHSKIIAVGEIGIDSTNPRYPPMELQRPAFERQLEIAHAAGLPAIVHSRGAEETAVRICKDIGVVDALFHCFTGNRAALSAVIDAGYYISISGIVTFRNNELRELVKSIPADRLLIETDTPYLAPVPHRGKQNRPAWVALTGCEIARMRGEAPEALADRLEKNFGRLFKKFTGTTAITAAANRRTTAGG